jgi:hypothetical protein
VQTALVALLAGALGAGITGLLQLRRDRIETLRQRQLDAADTFASALSHALLKVTLILDSYPKDPKEDESMERWRNEAGQLRDGLLRQVPEVAAHAPRVELLFGVQSPAAVAAVQAATDLAVMARALRPPIDVETYAWGFKLAAGSALRFHDEAHNVIAAPWWRRRRHKPLPDETFERFLSELEERIFLSDAIVIEDDEDVPE